VNWTRVSVGVGMVVVGLLWTGQGLGWIGGSFMSGVPLWAMIGPLVAGLGVMVVLGARPDQDGPDRDGPS
jgi:hypothetical protein